MQSDTPQGSHDELHIRLPAHVGAQVRAIAKSERRKVNQQVELVLAEWLEQVTGRRGGNEAVQV